MDVQKKIDPVAVKVCGVTLAADVGHCVLRRVGYVGFNFYRGSKRFIAPAAAAKVWASATDATGGGLTKPAGVFVGASVAEIAQAIEEFPALGVIQVHGPALVTPAYLQEVRSTIASRQLWLALPVATRAEITAAAAYARQADLLLFDSQHVPAGATVAGGSGQTFDWTSLAAYPAGWPFAVAGGLNAQNIGALAAAIQPVRPVLIDLCSGVERAPGQKDPARIDAVLRAMGGAW